MSLNADGSTFLPSKPPDEVKSFASLFKSQSGPSQVISPSPTPPPLTALKKVVYNNGEPGIYWSKDEIAESAAPLQQTLIGKCSYGRPFLGVIREFIGSKWMLKGEFFVGILDPRHIIIRFSQFEDFVHTWLRDNTFIEGYLFHFSNGSQNLGLVLNQQLFLFGCPCCLSP
ncbi:hypothetical protein L1049_019131 [Liquidambar formosana]|uniref:DUF4283 domain-containing protein n=1 Tax=Liquidambar formosana TaxID=63359 RepID=A0AAP0RB32_LIQFO